MRISCTIVWMVVVCSAILTTPRRSIQAGETGVVSGQVTDAETGEPLPGAGIALLGSNRGTVSDADGRYYLLGIRPGTYTLQYSYVGYRRNEISDVRIEGGQSLTMNVALHPTAIEMDAVVVVGT